MAVQGQYDSNVLGIQGARPYGAAGNQPADAVVTAIKPHGRGVPYLSDRPYDQPYADRPTCAGVRTDNQPCKAKAEAGKRCCAAHSEQE